MRLVIADDHPLMLAGLREVLSRDPQFEVVGQTIHAGEILPLVRSSTPDVLLLDDRMPGLDSSACIDAVVGLGKGVKVVVLSAQGDPLEVETAFRCGASGVILKTIDPRDLGPAIVQSVEGTAFHALGLPSLDGKRELVEHDLTLREREILRGVSVGMSNRAIAQQLGVSEPTVKFHLSSVFRKLGLSNRTEAAAWAIARGLQGPNDVRRAG